jgi:hypothetical protein
LVKERVVAVWTLQNQLVKAISSVSNPINNTHDLTSFPSTLQLCSDLEA